jgi:hypothetical protein
MREKKGANRIETSVWTVWKLTYEWPLAQSFFVRVPAVTVPFSACFFLACPLIGSVRSRTRSLVPFSFRQNRAWLFSFFVLCTRLHVFIYCFIADAKRFFWPFFSFAPPRCRAAFLGGLAMRAHSWARAATLHPSLAAL